MQEYPIIVYKIESIARLRVEAEEFKEAQEKVKKKLKRLKFQPPDEKFKIVYDVQG